VNVSIENPTTWAVPNVTIIYEVPLNVTTGCTVTGSNVGVCNLTMNNTKQFANFTISSLGASTTNYDLIYTTAVYANTTVINSIGNITDRGDILTYDANISTTLQNNSFSDINITLYDPTGNISWQNITFDVDINKTNSFIFQRVWDVPSNATSGQYRIEINAVDNTTKKGIYNNNTYFDVTDQLEFYVGNVTNTVNIAPKKHTDGTDWYFMEVDDVQFSGFLRDLNGNNITGNVNATIEGIGQDNSTTFGVSGFSVDFNWSSVTLGTHNLTIIAIDDNNNTATYKQEIYISNYANKTTVVVTGGSNNIYEYNKENVTMTVTVLDADDNKVYLGAVTVSGDYAGTKQTDANGVVTFTFPAPKTTTHSYTVTARSPLNTSVSAKVVNQTGAMDATHFGTYRSAWIYYEDINITPESPKVGQDITIAGEIYFSNRTACTSGSVNVKVKKGSYERNATITFTNITAINHKFSHEFEYTSDIGHATDVNFVADDWIYIFDGTLANCNYYGRTFSNVTSDDPSSGSDSFEVFTNATTTSSDSDSSSSSDTSSSDNDETCDDNSDCSSGDYCSSSNVCKPISCDDGIILDHVCISAYKISLSEYPKTISIEQGKSDNFDIKIKNTGYKNLTNLSVVFVRPITVNWTNWYTLTNITENLEIDGEIQTNVTITVPETAEITIYSFVINVSSSEKIYNETMNIQVLPGDKEKIIINKSLENLSVEIIAAKEELDNLMRKLNNGDTTLANAKLNTIENLHALAMDAISKGDYLTAYNQEKEITTLLTQVKSLMADSQIIVASTKTKNTMVVSVLILIVLFAGIIYYLWVPAPGYVPGKKHVSASIPYVGATKKTEDVSFLVNVKNRLNELIDDYKKQKEKEANAPEKYDFHKKNRWS
ncbi:hypothetical protein GQ473_06265, partial [archaeon]|nr:hypothetical protein [archaeon]